MGYDLNATKEDSFNIRHGDMMRIKRKQLEGTQLRNRSSTFQDGFKSGGVCSSTSSTLWTYGWKLRHTLHVINHVMNMSILQTIQYWSSVSKVLLWNLGSTLFLFSDPSLHGQLGVTMNPQNKTEMMLLVGGLNPSEKYESQLGWLFPIYGKIKNVPNHQPENWNDALFFSSYPIFVRFINVWPSISPKIQKTCDALNHQNLNWTMACPRKWGASRRTTFPVWFQTSVPELAPTGGFLDSWWLNHPKNMTFRHLEWSNMKKKCSKAPTRYTYHCILFDKCLILRPFLVSFVLWQSYCWVISPSIPATSIPYVSHQSSITVPNAGLESRMSRVLCCAYPYHYVYYILIYIYSSITYVYIYICT